MNHGTAIQPFDFRGSPVGVITIDGDPWFATADICKQLDLRLDNVLSGLDQDEKTSCTVGGVLISLISESGVYSTIMRSRKSTARDFKRWVTREVLPQIRRTGGYMPVVLDPTLQRIVDLTVEMQMTRDEQRRQAQEIVKLADEAADHDARLVAIEGHHDWYAALGYARLNGLPTSEVWLKRLGFAAGKIGRSAGLVEQKVPHAHYGSVNSWPTWVWDAAVEARRSSGEDMLS